VEDWALVYAPRREMSDPGVRRWFRAAARLPRAPRKLERLLVCLGLLLLAAGLVGCAGASTGKQGLEAALREEIHSVAVPEAGASIVITSFRPSGTGPFPWLVLSHGSATTAEANRAIGRYRPLPPIREWVRRGYAVMAPVRRGYGASGGEKFGDAYGSCSRPDFRRAGEGAAQDLVAVLAFAPGRGGDPATRPGEPSGSDRMAQLYASIAPQTTVPVLWFYAENDQFIGPRVQKLWFESFRSAGGRGELVVVLPFPERYGHGVFPSTAGTPLWTPVVARFFSAQGLPLTFRN
jgi:hypothetical protein